VEKYEEIERALIKTYRKKIWNRFTKGIREYDMIQKEIRGLGDELVELGFYEMEITTAINKENERKIQEEIEEMRNRKIEVDYAPESEINNSFDELVSVLESLGYKNSEIKKVLPKVNASLDIESQIKEALKLMLK